MGAGVWSVVGGFASAVFCSAALWYRSAASFARHYMTMCDSGPEGRALDEFEDQVFRTDIEDLADVRVAEGGDGLRFLPEPRAFRLEALDRDNAVQPCVVRRPHFSHPTGADGRIT